MQTTTNDKQTEHQNEDLNEMVRLLQIGPLGRKSESHLAATDHQQQPLFTPSQPAQTTSDAQKEPVKGHTRRKHDRIPLPENLPRLDVVYDILDADKRCTCGSNIGRIGEDVCEKLDYVPVMVEVIRHILPKYTCKGWEGGEDEGPTVKIAPPAVQLIPPKKTPPRG
jgi:hypothetical protein